MIIEKYTRTEIEEVEDLDATVRGEGGFGSTGVKLSDNKENSSVTNTVNMSSKKRSAIELENKHE